MFESLRAYATEAWDLHAVRFAFSFLSIVGILAGAKVIQSILARLTAWALRPRSGKWDLAAAQRRAQTLLPLLVEIERYLLYTAVAVAILARFGIDTAAIFASVGVVGVALGFGAQNLVKDMIAGFFLLFDGLVAVGDVIKIDDKTTGTVEAVGLRNTQVRDFSGLLWMIPNGDLRQFGNLNRGWMRAVVILEVAYEADVPKAMELARQAGETWAAANPEKVIEPPEVHALLGMAQASLSLRLVMKVKPNEQWPAERALRLMVKDRFVAEGIELPYPRHVLLDGPKRPPAQPAAGKALASVSASDSEAPPTTTKQPA
ncbi:mechanosensitive ion channel family protein [Vulgatibacter incomptus]|uniref:Potassium efflux system KefA protein / Small-conductance mechanosensitive channel n=1 Tax=Vulgatibacter incomptus TaxID=1391653 RepID=A0A0K1PDT6_9BACT|nr:mechanosensitive ion channel family protein [Vulgatibacter incomptus]AKU91269.1 Potassium efflux system KefA protein / Small-conductance mechanosensitive channel [Vulgatibacter incomptus]